MTQVCAQALDEQRRELDLPNDGVAAAAQKTADAAMQEHRLNPKTERTER